MTSEKYSVIDSSSEQKPLVCLYARDDTYLASLREFLESYGCSVAINLRTSNDPVYKIIIGSPDFVKELFADGFYVNGKTYLLLWHQQDLNINDFENQADKIAIIDQKPISPQLINQIFSFFFTSHERIIDISTHEEMKLEAPIEIIEEVPQTITGEFEEYEANEPQPVEEHVYENQEIENIENTENYLNAYDHKIADIKIEENSNYDQPLFKHIDFAENEKNTSIIPDSDKKRIRDTMSEIFGKISQPKIKVNIQKKPKIIKLLFGFLAIILLPIIWYCLTLFTSGIFLYFSVILFNNGKIGFSQKGLNISHGFIKQSENTFALISIPFSLVGQDDILNNQEKLLIALDDISTAGSSAMKIISDSDLLTKNVVSKDYSNMTTNASLAKLASSLKTDLPPIIEQLGFAQASLEDLVSNKNGLLATPFLKDIEAKALLSLGKIRTEMQFMQNIVSIYTAMGGFKENKTYLVLLQNSMELRPTGGFIGSIAKVVLNEGMVDNIQILDVYTVDGQLRGHADPPLPIRDILGQEHWYLRDSNWNPNFSDSAKTAAWFYEKETGTTVDGVIAVNSPFIVDLLKATGPINLPDYNNDRITADNFFGKSLYYVHSNFFPGSTQKKDFLGSLFEALLTKLTQSHDVNQVLLMRSIKQAIEKRNILFYMTDTTINSALSAYDWAGDFPDKKLCVNTGKTYCYADYFANIDANLSVSKVNYFIKKLENFDIKINSDGTVGETVNLKYTNTATDNTIGVGGVYRNYTRFYIPEDATTSSVLLNGQPVSWRNTQKNEIKNIPYLELGQVQNGIREIGLIFDVPLKSEVQVNFIYKRLKQIPVTGKIIYEMYRQKQPGIQQTSGETVISYPADWQIIPDVSNLKASSVANVTQLRYNNSLESDDHISILRE
jgi:hypothetical protein